ncbi:MAG TPA: hypothetical protein PKI99_05855, partial [Terrimesophilobacter sp.]|nr:hypothetical protein [Terrimesophilobacter sp.]
MRAARSSWTTGVVVLCLAHAVERPAKAQGASFQQVDVSTAGVQGNSTCTSLHVSGNGRFVAFNSMAGNLVPGDSNGAPDGFVRDLLLGTTELIGLGTQGQQAASETVARGISEDGRFVVFVTRAANLDPADTDLYADVYVRDRQTATTELISVLMDSTPSISDCLQASISADGRYVAFHGGDPNFVPGDTNQFADVFVRDRLLGVTTLVSVDNTGSIGRFASGYPSISADGQRVAFQSLAKNFHPSETGNQWHVYLRDLAAGTTIALDLNPSGELGSKDAYEPTISADGSSVAFISGAADLLASGPLNEVSRGYVWREGLPIYCPPLADGKEPAGGQDNGLSADGRYLVFTGGQTQYVAGDPTASFDIFLHDLWTGVTSQVSSNGFDQPGNDESKRGSISDDGRVIGFLSQATNLVAGTTPGVLHAFVRISDPTPGLVFCSPTKSPVGCLPALSAQGKSSASAGSGHTITVIETLNDQVGLFVYSTARYQALPFAGGYLCVGFPLRRMPA